VKKLHLVCPAEASYRKLSARNFHSPALMAVASVTPPDWEIVLTQMQRGDPITYHDDVDVVGITMMTNQSASGYEIADAYRARGKKVVVGGIHPSVLPDEALAHADAVVVGEVEGIWEQILDDLGHDRSAGIYRPEEPLDMARVPPFRTDLFSTATNSFSVQLIQVARGCPYDCEFCSVGNLFGKRFRTRPVADVLAEIEASKARSVFFLDDNIIGDPRYAKELFRGLTPLKKKWVGQASLNVFCRPELLELAARSGCTGIFLGIESMASKNLDSTGSFGKNRFRSQQELTDKLQRIHDARIAIMASVIFGLDDDTPDIFQRTVDYLIETGVACASLPILTPYPGCRTFDRLEKAGRLLSYDWRLYNNETPVFTPARMSTDMLKAGADWASYEFYRLRYMPRRFLRHYDHPLFVPAMSLGWHVETRRYKEGWQRYRSLRNGEGAS
jgi:radical SAM superfamily enzyme YgiQ (UPF0313 family)